MKNFSVKNLFVRSGNTIKDGVTVEQYLKWRLLINTLNNLPESIRLNVSKYGTDIESFYGCVDDHVSGNSYEFGDVVTLDEALDLLGVSLTQDPQDFIILGSGLVVERDDDLYEELDGKWYLSEDIVEVSNEYGGGLAYIGDTNIDIHGCIFRSADSWKYQLHYSDKEDGYVSSDWDDVYYGVYDNYGSTGYFISDEAVYTYDTDRWFYSEDVARANGCRYSSSEGEWYQRRAQRNADYHELDRLSSPDFDAAVFTVGFEIEKEDEDGYDITYEQLYKRTKWIKEEDGSLGSYGYELVSPRMDLYGSFLEESLNDDEIVTLINGDYSDSCGGHIHIASTKYSNAQLFEGLSGFYPLLYAMYESRVYKNYSKAQKKHEYYRYQRTVAVNLNDYTVELRIFPAVKSVSNILWRRDLLRIMCDNINADEVKVLKMMCNTNSKLYKHLRKIFTQETIIQKISKFIQYADDFSNKKIEFPTKNVEEMRKKKSNLPNADGTSTDLGA
jgi:hypothetical protein